MNSLLPLAISVGIKANSVCVLSDHATTVVAFEETEVIGRIYKPLVGEPSETGREVLSRERLLGLYLANAGVSVTRPLEDVDVLPFEDTWISFWHREYFDDGVADGRQIATSLLELERAFSNCPVDLPRLVAWNSAGRVAAKRALNESDERLQTLARMFYELDEVMSGVTFCKTHGDSHPGNLMKTSRGWIWIDLGDAGWMPQYWDLATAITRTVVLGSHLNESKIVLQTYAELSGKSVVVDDLSFPLLARCVQETLICWDMGDDDVFVRSRIENMTKAMPSWGEVVQRLFITDCWSH